MNAEKTPKHWLSARCLMWLGSLVIIILLSLCAWLYYQYQQAMHAPNLAQQLVVRIGGVVQLPKETPILLTITDKTKLGTSPLAQQVENGDQLLVFNKARQVIIYHPATQKVTGMLTVRL